MRFIFYVAVRESRRSWPLKMSLSLEKFRVLTPTTRMSTRARAWAVAPSRRTYIQTGSILFTYRRLLQLRQRNERKENKEERNEEGMMKRQRRSRNSGTAGVPRGTCSKEVWKLAKSTGPSLNLALVALCKRAKLQESNEKWKVTEIKKWLSPSIYPKLSFDLLVASPPETSHISNF